MPQSQQVRRATSDGTLTRNEIRNLSSAGIGMDKILSVAAKTGTEIQSSAQRAYGIDQNSRTGAISYTPALYAGGANAPAPGSGWVVTGQQVYQTNNPQSGSTNNVAPTYTYMGAPSSGGGGGSRNPIPGYPTVDFSAKSTAPGVMAPASSPATAPTDPMQAWLDSLGIGIQTLTDSLNKQIADNQANQQAYMEMMGNLASQMTTANNQMFSGPYAVTTQNAVPVMGAQTTQAISRRLKSPTTSLSITPETTTAGTGLNIAA